MSLIRKRYCALLSDNSEAEDFIKRGYFDMNSTRNKILVSLLNNIPIVLFIVIFIIFGIMSPRFFSIRNFENIATQASYIGIIAVGMTFVLLTGGIDLSVGANMFLSASAAGLIINEFSLPTWVALVIAVGIGFVFGAVNAFAVVKLKILPFIVTLSMMFIGRGITLVLTESQAVSFPESVTGLGSLRILNIPMPVIIFAVVVFFAYVVLKRTPLGRQIYAVGNDIEAANKAGINSKKVLVSVYIISGVLAAVGGIVSVAQLGIVNAGFGDGDEFDAIASAVLGGTSLFGGIGSVFPGTLIGTVLIQMIQAGLVYVQVDLYIQPLISAAIIFLAVLLDSIRKAQISKMERRNIRTEKDNVNAINEHERNVTKS